MKFRLSFLALTLLVGVIVTSCKDDPPPPKTDEEINLELLAKTWVPKSTQGVTSPAGDATQDWSTFELTFTSSKAYSTVNTPANNELIWPASGTWDFGSNANTLVRNDGLEISISVSETSLTMNFTYTAGRVNGIEGPWVFNMTPK